MNDTPEKTKLSWWRRLSSGLKRTSSSLGTAVADLVTKRKLDRAMLEDIEDVLLRADLGTEVAARISAAVGHGRYDKTISADDVKAVVATEVEKVLSPVAKPLVIDAAQKPFVILVVGVNGSGKTTTIGKLAAKLAAEGRKVMLAAGDTFRAAAIEQLKIWGERTKSPVIAAAQGSDSASLAFNALTAAREQQRDVLLIDTAGRLQNKAELMNELEKVVRHQEGRRLGAACGAAGAGCHGGTKCAVAGRGVSSYRRCDRSGHDETRRHRAGRHPGGAGREAQTAGALYWCRGRYRRPRSLHRTGFRAGDRRD